MPMSAIKETYALHGQEILNHRGSGTHDCFHASRRKNEPPIPKHKCFWSRCRVRIWRRTRSRTGPRCWAWRYRRYARQVNDIEGDMLARLKLVTFGRVNSGHNVWSFAW